MYVCLCHAVTEAHIVEAVGRGARRLKDLRSSLRVAARCGKCATCARQCLRRNVADDEVRCPLSVNPVPSLPMAEAG